MPAHHHHECHDHGHKHGFLARLRGHSHEYSLETKEDRNRLFVCMLANGAYGALQLVVGFWLLRSMILATDASHNISDMVTLGIPLLVIWLRGRSRLAPLVLIWLNYALLLYFLGWAALESWRRISAPENSGSLVSTVRFPLLGAVNSGIVMACMAGVGIGVNLYSVIILEKGKHHDLNMRSAFEHQLVDLVASATAVLASIAIAVTGQHLIDPLLTIGASAVLAWMVWPNFAKAWHDLSKAIFAKMRERSVR